MPSRVFSAQFENLDPIRAFVGEVARRAGMNEQEVYNVQLAVDEACSNIIEYAYERHRQREIGNQRLRHPRSPDDCHPRPGQAVRPNQRG